MTAEVVARRIGTEQLPVVVIDDFHSDPDSLRAHAAIAAFEPAHRHYPGIRAALPSDYFARVRATLAPVLREVFDYQGTELIDASFSIVTTPPAMLSIPQRLPHVDSLELGRVALVHFLAIDEGDGTAFYRHRATGFESVGQARSGAYYAQLNTELRQGGAPAPAYICDSDPQFERLHHVEARYNRALIYPSAMLHSGVIAPGATLEADPSRGRLTVTAFFAKG